MARPSTLLNEMKLRSLIASAAWLLFASSGDLHAAAIEAEGIAPIDRGGAEYARRRATDDAVRQASLQLGAVVVSSEQTAAGGAIVQSGSVRPAATVNRFAVVREWNDGRDVHVLVRADDEAGMPAPASAQGYRKKVLLAPFHIAKPVHVSDIDDAGHGIPRTLSERLAQSGRFQTRVGRFAVPLEGAEWTSAQISSLVRRLAQENDSQFVLSGELVDAGTVSDKGFFVTNTRRSFEVRVMLYDGLTGTLIAEHRASRAGAGQVTIGANKPFGSASFFATGFGKAVDAVLGSLATEVADDLEPLPFTARIVRIENRKVIFDAGATSAVAPGDTLAAYSRRAGWDVGAPMQGAVGILENPVATVSVVQVHPDFSVAELPAESARAVSKVLKAGDYLRFASSR